MQHKEGNLRRAPQRLTGAHACMDIAACQRVQAFCAIKCTVGPHLEINPIHALYLQQVPIHAACLQQAIESCLAPEAMAAP